MKYLLDTNICVYFLNGQFELDQQIARMGLANCYISEITILELLYGVSNSDSSKQADNLKKVIEFEKVIAANIIPIRVCFEEFAQHKTLLRKSGKQISDFDLLIGCSALANNMILVTRNMREMERISGLRIENWIDAPNK